MFAILSASALGWRSFSRSRTTDRAVPSTRGIGTKASGMNVQICFGWGNLVTSIAFGRSGGCSTGDGGRERFPNQQDGRSLPGLSLVSKQNRKRRGVLASRWLVVAVTRSWLSAGGRTYWTIPNEHGCLPQRERGRCANAAPHQA
jgi:hypothetical protein